MSQLENTPHLVLASASPRRSELLRMLGASFTALPSEIEEDSDPTIPVGELVERNALAKASDVARRMETGLVIGADTVVALDGKVYGKPSDIEDARRMLSTLAGRTHRVYSGVAVVRAEDGESRTARAITEVTFRQLSHAQIDRYFEMIEPLDKAGSYAIQGPGGVIIEKISGCYYNVVGLPLTVLDELLSHFDEKLF